MEGDYLVFDIAAWAEDREELRDLRGEIIDVHEEVQRIAFRLERDARKIHKACDQLDHLSRDLGRM